MAFTMGLSPVERLTNDQALAFGLRTRQETLNCLSPNRKATHVLEADKDDADFYLDFRSEAQWVWIQKTENLKTKGIKIKEIWGVVLREIRWLRDSQGG